MFSTVEETKAKAVQVCPSKFILTIYFSLSQ